MDKEERVNFHGGIREDPNGLTFEMKDVEEAGSESTHTQTLTQYGDGGGRSHLELPHSTS